MSSVMLESVKTVVIKPFKKNAWLPEGHDGEFRFTGTHESLVPVRNGSNGMIETGLTKEQETYFEGELLLSKGTLSRYNLDYWGEFRINIPKTGLKLDLNTAKHEMMYHVLLVHPKVARNIQEAIQNPNYDYVMSSEEADAKEANVRAKVKRNAMKKFSTMSTDDMWQVLSVMGKRPSEDASSDWIEVSLDRLIEENPQNFLDIVDDESFKMKLFITNCLYANLITKRGSKYELYGGDVIGTDLLSAVSYLANPEHQDVYLSLKTRLDGKLEKPKKK